MALIHTYEVDGEEVKTTRPIIEAGVLLKKVGTNAHESALLREDDVFVPPSNTVDPRDGPFTVVER